MDRVIKHYKQVVYNKPELGFSDPSVQYTYEVLFLVLIRLFSSLFGEPFSVNLAPRTTYIVSYFAKEGFSMHMQNESCVFIRYIPIIPSRYSERRERKIIQDFHVSIFATQRAASRMYLGTHYPG